MGRGWKSIGWLLVPLLSACSGDDDGGVPACVGNDPRCADSCSAIQPCPVGLHCGLTGRCEKQCDAMHACGNGGLCSADGTCMAAAADGGAVRAGNGGRSATAGQGGRGATPGGPRPGSCADTIVTTTRTTPTVILIVDQSSSMTEEFDNGSRWNVLRDFLLEPSGLIADLQSQVNFGLALYSAVSGGSNPLPMGECPMVTTVAPAANNFEAIAATYRDAEPIEDTPTGDSIDRVVDEFGFTDPDATRDPVVFVLATDGEPDRCEELDPQNGQAETLAAVQRAYANRIRTYVISVGNEIGEQHQQDVANAGLGRQPGDPNAEYWRAGDDQSLRAALTSIVGGQLGCEIQLNGRVPESTACSLGKVMLNGGEPLTCGDPNGWELLDAQHIRLLGSACEELKSSADVYLDVAFPCQVPVVF